MSKSFRSFCRSINNCRAGRKVTTRKRSNFERGGEDRFPEITTRAAAFVIPRQNNVTIFESFFAFRNRTCRSFYRWHVVAFFPPSEFRVPKKSLVLRCQPLGGMFNLRLAQSVLVQRKLQLNFVVEVCYR